MRLHWNVAILLCSILLAAACSPAPTEAELTATQETLASPTPTVTVTSTFTPTPTITPTITPTPTITLTPTVTPPVYAVELQANGTTLVQRFTQRFQFTLPAGWTYSPVRLGSATNGTTDIVITINNDYDSPEDFLHGRGLVYEGLGLTIRREQLMTNPHNVPMGVLEASGEWNGNNFHEYHIVFRSGVYLIEIDVDGDIDAGRYDLGLIQNSIQAIR